MRRTAEEKFTTSTCAASCSIWTMVRKIEQQLKVTQIILQHLDFDGSFFTTWYCKHGIKKLPNHWWTRGYHFHDTIGYHSNNMIAILGQVKKLMYMGFWAILNFRNFRSLWTLCTGLFRGKHVNSCSFSKTVTRKISHELISTGTRLPVLLTCFVEDDFFTLSVSYSSSACFEKSVAQGSAKKTPKKTVLEYALPCRQNPFFKMRFKRTTLSLPFCTYLVVFAVFFRLRCGRYSQRQQNQVCQPLHQPKLLRQR